MGRSPFQVLILPFRRTLDSDIQYAAFRRADDGCWQGLAGGGEDEESPVQAAVREGKEEAGIPTGARYYRLDAMCSIPAYHFTERHKWPSKLYVVPEHTFAVDCSGIELRLSAEHAEHVWGSYEEVYGLLRWDSNKTALGELRERLKKGDLR